MPKRIVKLVRENQTVSLRLRLTLWIVLFFSAIQWITCGVFWLYQSASINQIFNGMLAEKARVLASELTGAFPELSQDELRVRMDRAVRSVQYETFLIDVFDAEGNHAVTDAAPLVDPASLPLGRVFESELPIPVINPVWTPAMERLKGQGVRSVLVGVQGADGAPYAVFFATSDQFAREQLSLVRRVLVTSAAVVPLAAVLSGWFIAGVAVAPFRRVQLLVRQLWPQSFDKSIEFEATTSEVSALAEELEQARVRIQEAFAAQERFLSNVSHEIKTPIAVMLIEAETIDLTDKSPDVEYFVGSVREEMARLGSLVESFLTLTRIEDGHGQVRGTPLAANDLAMDSVEHCAVMANQSRVWLRPRLFADDDTIDTMVAGDAELLTTMLDNLIRNAIRYSPAEAGVEVELTRDDNTVNIAVRDSGPGIPESKLDSVFDRFAQADAKDRRGRGHGLGLAIALGIAELHGGSIRVRNLERGGCEFTVTLPRVEPLNQGGSAATSHGSNGTSRS